ncbi:hydroxysqualene dehydroxylase HpnE [Ideonella livida]|uniref:NAD(P)-binding protein n=1 Tax=Ideonella livida TaxID=2707176 RepID=A0A7C9PGX3_9BURK|nr:hydroxysqualene dehydroxylase HpnE [Ideonella livida]NDY90734.1 NAD(P)-binding protein [Ideonella livida]
MCAVAEGALGRRRIAIIGAGWSGLAAAVHATAAGADVTVYEAGRQPGGRAASTTGPDGTERDTGQHILIGAYRATLGLMSQVGVDPAQVLRRLPMALVDPAGRGLTLHLGGGLLHHAASLLGWSTLPWRARLGGLLWLGRWQAARFQCPPGWTVARLVQGCPQAVVEQLIEPLCVAALNTPMAEADAQILLNVFRSALAGPRGSADLLLPAAALSDLLPRPACAWLSLHGAQLRMGTPVRHLAPITDGRDGWIVETETFDQVILATPARVAARLTADCAPQWAALAHRLPQQAIATAWLRVPTTAAEPDLPAMSCLKGALGEPAQFAFSLAKLHGHGQQGVHTLVASGVAHWATQPREALAGALQAQFRRMLGAVNPTTPPPSAGSVATQLLHLHLDRQATFACLPGLDRPPARIRPGLWAAGDYIAGPYPATLEGAVLSGQQAVEAANAATSRS